MIIGRLLVLVATILWSTSGIFAKATFFDEWPADSRGSLLAFWRAVFACVALLVLVRRPGFTWAMLAMMVTYVVMNYSFLQAMVVSEAGSVIWLQYTCPVWIFLGSHFFFHEEIHVRDWWLLVFAFLGVSVILVDQLSGTESNGWGVFLSLLSGITYAGVVLFLRAMRRFDAAWLITLNQVATIVAFAPVLIHTRIWPTGIQWPILAVFGILQMGAPYLLFAMGVKRIAGHEASGICLLEPILVPLWVFLVWHEAAGYEPPRWSTYVGGALILSGLLVRYMGEATAMASQRRNRGAKIED